MIKLFLKRNFFSLVLVLISVLVCGLNYVPGTYLSGWDTIHPEFNFADYFKRTLSVWQQHQGLGAVASQAHAAELPRLLFYWLSSFVLPESFLRYSYFFLCLVLGPLGVAFFCKNLIRDKVERFSEEVISFIAGLFYLLNLTVVQHFFVPLEMFATHYAFLPWIMLFSTKYIVTKSKKSLVIFSGLTLYSSSFAHTPTLFYSFFITFAPYILMLSKFAKKLKAGILILLLSVLLNAFWILPNAYFILNYGQSVANSKIHYQFSERAFQTGVNHGNLVDTALQKNFLFDWGEYDVNQGRFVVLLKDWKEHLSQPLVGVIGFSFFVMSVLGIIFSLRRKNPWSIAFLPVFLIPFVFICNDNIVFQTLIGLTDEKYPVITESLRFPFTKFSILLLFSYSVYLAIFLTEFIPYFKRFKKLNQKVFSYILGLILAVAIVFYMLPAFKGELINPNMKVNIPSEYFEMFNYFSKQNLNQRIAFFPINSFWGWEYYNWNFEGAGFLWFGLNQPILEREFDRWHPANENYYSEISNAVYSQNDKLFSNVLEKYQIDFLLVDKSVLDPSSSKSVYFAELEQMMKKNSQIVFDKEFGNLKIYKVSRKVAFNNFVGLVGVLPEVGPKYEKNNLDQAFDDNNFYQSAALSEKVFDVYYPFRSIFANRNANEFEYRVDETADEFIFSKTVPENVGRMKLQIPKSGEIIWYDPEDLANSGTFSPKVSFDGRTLLVKIPKLKNYFSDQIDPSKKVKLNKLIDCDYLDGQSIKSQSKMADQVVVVNEKSYLRLNSVLSNNCSAEFLISNISHQFGYLISIESRNIQSKSILFWLENITNRRSDLETFLPKVKEYKKLYFIQPPMDKYGQGYFLHFNNVSYNKRETVNDLGEVAIYPIPYEYLTKIYFSNSDKEVAQPLSQTLNVDCNSQVYHPIAFYYRIDFGSKNCENLSKTLVLSQSFDKGWRAWDGGNIFKVYDHKIINNWENGWDLSESDNPQTVVIFFLPELLQILGYIILLGCVVYLFK